MWGGKIFKKSRTLCWKIGPKSWGRKKLNIFSAKNDLCVQGILEGNIYRFLLAESRRLPIWLSEAKKVSSGKHRLGHWLLKEVKKISSKPELLVRKCRLRLGEEKVQGIFGRLAIRCHKPTGAKEISLDLVFSGLDFPFVYWRKKVQEIFARCRIQCHKPLKAKNISKNVGKNGTRSPLKEWEGQHLTFWWMQSIKNIHKE